jgi:hypothetical protein
VKQQINLYQPIFRKQQKVFSAVTMLQITAFFIVVLSSVYAFNVHKLKPFSVELKKANDQFEKLSNQIEVLSKTYSMDGKRRLMESETALSEGSFGNVTGFSGYFEALAMGRVEGAWLTGISIAGGGEKLNFSGKSIDPELVPVYIKRLADAPVFHNQNFNVVELKRISGPEELISFNIGTGGQ